MPRHPATNNLKSFAGINNRDTPEKTDPKYLKVAENIDIDKTGEIFMRKGSTILSSGSFHSLWSDGRRCYCVKDGNLINIDNNFTETTVVSGIGDTMCSFEHIEGTTYWCNAVYNGAIVNGVNRSWGIPRPNRNPICTVVTPGSLEAGRYQVSLTYAASDGRESGTGIAAIIDVLSNGSGISLSNFPSPTDSTVTHYVINISTQNGDTLYRHSAIPLGTSTFVIRDLRDNMTPLNSFNVFTAPVGTLVRYYKGRSYIVQDNVLWYSEPFSYEWFRLQSGYFHFEDDIVDVAPMEDGIYVGTTTRIYWLQGSDPAEMRAIEKEPVVMVRGTISKVDGSSIFIEQAPLGYKKLVMTNEGIFALFNQGFLVNTTYRNVNFPFTNNQGASSFFKESGISKYIVTMPETKESNNVQATDLVTGTIIRNGIQI